MKYLVEINVTSMDDNGNYDQPLASTTMQGDDPQILLNAATVGMNASLAAHPATPAARLQSLLQSEEF